MDEKLRLFVACGPLPDWAKSHHAALTQLKSELKSREVEALWSLPQNLHITLNFLGERASSEVPEITAQLHLAVASLAPFRLKTKGLGAFPEIDSARVLFADVTRSKALLAAQAQIEAALELSDGEKEFHPHVTLARLRNLKSLRRIIEPWRNRLSGHLHVDSIRLFKSVRKGHYSVYEPLASFPLLGAPAPS